VIADPAAVPIERAGLLDHRGRDVDAVGLVEVIGERLRQAAEAAAE
jgi:hypothetical protein